VIIPDVNVLVYAHNRDFSNHLAAKRWWEETLTSGEEGVGLPWACLFGFLRIVTSRTVMANPLTAAHGITIARTWLAQGALRTIVPGERHGEIALRLLEEIGVAGNLTMDAHLAALALEYRAEIATTDADFARFRGVRWFNPISGKRGR